MLDSQADGATTLVSSHLYDSSGRATNCQVARRGHVLGWEENPKGGIRVVEAEIAD